MYAQKIDQKLYYSTPLTRTGVTNVLVDFTYEIINAMGEIQVIGDAFCSGGEGSLIGFTYKNREWLVDRRSNFAIKIYDPVIEMNVEGPNGFKKTVVLGITSGMGGGSLFGNSVNVKTATNDAERNPSNYRIVAFDVKNVSFSNYYEVTKILDEKIEREKLEIEVKQMMVAAQNAENKKDWEGAVYTYEDILIIDPANKIANEKLKKAQEKVADKQAKAKAEEWIKKARQAESQGNKKDAMNFFEEAAKTDPYNSLAKNEANRLRDVLKREEEAKKIQEEKEAQAKKEKEEIEEQDQKALEEKQESEARESNNNKAQEKGSNNEKSEPSDAEKEAWSRYYVASVLEKEGDLLYKNGDYAGALQKYRDANSRYSTPALQTKITNLENLVGTAKFAGQLATAISNKFMEIADYIDPDYETDFSHLFLQLNGLPFNKNYVNSLNTQGMPADLLFGYCTQRLLMTFQARWGFTQSDYFELNVERAYDITGYEWQEIPEKVLVKSSGATIGVSAGINLPIFNSTTVLYGIFGYDYRWDLSSTVYSPVFTAYFKDKVNSPVFSKKIECGFHWAIPNTDYGIGLNLARISYKATEIDPTKRQYLALKSDPNNTDWFYRFKSYNFEKQRLFMIGLKLYKFF